MNQKELKELIEFLIEKNIAEFELERGDVKMRIKRGVDSSGSASHEPRFIAVHSAVPAAVAGVPAMAPTVTSAPPAKVDEQPAEEQLSIVRSPIVGTFYESPSPGSPPFIKIGDKVNVGQVLCIVEAMKLMNEIESDVAGEVVKKLVSNGQPIEYGQELFAIRAAK
ncbi:MAG TPA: acetyl-CoA carboxylase biotin carboxyl carrier protein [Terriglobales bacterium]|jgi:acetyl-CoA carboxylase biotin carboxyl carrier protein